MLTVGGIYFGAGVYTTIIGRILRIVEYNSDSTAVRLIATLSELVVSGGITAVVAIITVPLLVGAYADMRARLDGDVHAGRLGAELVA